MSKNTREYNKLAQQRWRASHPVEYRANEDRQNARRKQRRQLRRTNTPSESESLDG